MLAGGPGIACFPITCPRPPDAGGTLPELPEVESAVRELRRAASGKVIARVDLLHPSLQKRITKRAARRLIGSSVTAVERRGKQQLIRLSDGATMVVHFRMAGDWVIDHVGDELPRHARATLALEDGTRVVLADSRALCTIDLHAPGAEPAIDVGPEPLEPGFTGAVLGARLAAKRSAIKPALLDQRVVAGVGNIYAAESLWRARIHPARDAASLDREELARLARAIRSTLRDGLRRPGRYAREEEVDRLDVYGRAGEPCRRCGTAITRIVQAGRSTFFCPVCQSQ